MSRALPTWRSAIIAGSFGLSACEPSGPHASSRSPAAQYQDAQAPHPNDRDAAAAAHLLGPPGTIPLGDEVSLGALHTYAMDLVADTCILVMATAAQSTEISMHSTSLHTAVFQVGAAPTMLPPAGLACLRRGDTLHLSARGSATVRIFAPESSDRTP